MEHTKTQFDPNGLSNNEIDIIAIVSENVI